MIYITSCATRIGGEDGSRFETMSRLRKPRGIDGVPHLESGKPYSYIFCTNSKCIHHNHNIASHHFSGETEAANSAQAIADWNERASISLNS